MVPSSFALTLTLEGNNSVATGLNGYGPYQTGVGGEFTFQIDNPSLISGYSSLARNQNGIANSFQTFCVEANEYIDASHPVYTANYNNITRYSNDQLSKGAAFLYSQFAQGTLSGYNYHTSSAGREASAGMLQRALWLLMGGQEGLTPANIGANPFVAAAETAFGGFAGASAAATTGFDNVYVLNMWDSNLRAAQDQLIYTPGAIPNAIAPPDVPDGGMTAMLLGIGFTGVAFISRRARR